MQRMALWVRPPPLLACSATWPPSPGRGTPSRPSCRRPSRGVPSWKLPPSRRMIWRQRGGGMRSCKRSSRWVGQSPDQWAWAVTELAGRNGRPKSEWAQSALRVHITSAADLSGCSGHTHAVQTDPVTSKTHFAAMQCFNTLADQLMGVSTSTGLVEIICVRATDCKWLTCTGAV